MFGKNVPIKEIKIFDLQRRVAAHKTYEAWETIPHAGGIIELDVTKLMKFVKGLKNNPEFEGIRITLNSVLLKILAEGLKMSPEMNAYIKYNKKTKVGETIVLDDINIAMPLLLPDGRTITPVLKQCGKRTIKQLCIDMMELQRKAQNTNIDIMLFDAAWIDSIENLKKGKIINILRRLRSNVLSKKTRIYRPKRAEIKKYKEEVPETDRLTVSDILSATVLVSNIGSEMRGISIYITLLEIIPPQITVFGIPPITKKPVVIGENGEDTIQIRNILPLTLYIDHRALDFAHCRGFFAKTLELVNNPEKLLDL